MSHINDTISDSNLSKRSSETKLLKSTRKSRLPKSSPNKTTLNRPKTTDTQGNETTLDFPTRMKLKDKISELQQLNNELRFKLTTAETKLRAKDSEVIAAESLNKQIKQLLDKHINREQELNSQIMNLEKKLAKINQQVVELEEDKEQFSHKKDEFDNLVQINKELNENLAVKEAQILDLSGLIAEVKQSFGAASIRNKSLESQLDEVMKVEPMLDVRKNYISYLEEKVRHLEGLCSNLNEENCKLKYGVEQLERFRFHSFLAAMERDVRA